MFSWALQLAAAGTWSFIWHWGVGIGIIILCLAGAYFTETIPIIGPWLGRERKGLIFVAGVTAAILVGEYIGARDEANRCVAKTVVIEKIVNKTVEKAKKSTAKDIYDDPGN